MHKLLFVHPDYKLQRLYTHRLSEYFSIDSASDGIQALRLLKSSKPDLVVSDYHLPYLSGAGLLTYVRRHPQMHAIPFIFLSHAHPETESLGLGANDWLIVAHTNPDILAAKCFDHIKLKVR
jgi:DNA-binding response OmpR family regulator